MKHRTVVTFILTIAFFNAIFVVNAESQDPNKSVNLDSVKQSNIRLWLKAQKHALTAEKNTKLEPLNYEQTMAKLEKEKKEARLQRINEEIEVYKELVSQAVKNSTPTFGLDIEDTTYEIQGLEEIEERAPLQAIPLPQKTLAQCLLQDNGDYGNYQQPPYKDWKFKEYNKAVRNIMSSDSKLKQKGIKNMSKLMRCKFWGVREAANYQMLLYHFTGDIDQYYRPNPAGYSVHDGDLYATPSVKILALSGKMTAATIPYNQNVDYCIVDKYVISDMSLSPKVRNIIRVLRGDTFYGNDISAFKPEFLEALGYELCTRALQQKQKVSAPDMVELVVKKLKVASAEEKASIPLKVERLSVLYPYISHLGHEKLNPDIGLTATELIAEGKKCEADKNKHTQADNTIRAIFYYTRAALYGSFEGFQNLIRIYCETYSPSDDRELLTNVFNLHVLRHLCPTLRDMKGFKDFLYLLEPLEPEINETYKIYKDALEKKNREEAWANYLKKKEKKERRNRFWTGMAQSALNALGQTASMMYNQNRYVNGAVQTQMPQFNGFGGVGASGNMDYLLDPRFAVAQVQAQELQDYQRVRESYQRMGRDLTLDEFRLLKGQAIMDLKEQGYDVIAEQKKINDDMRNFNRSQMNSGKENVERIKEQNARKYGTSNNSNTTASTSNSSNSSKSASTISTSRFSSTNTTETLNNRTSLKNTTITKNDAHKQYKDGNLNTQKSSYGDKIKNVRMAVKDGSSYRNVNLHGELYKKDGQYYVKIGGTFFKVEHTGGSYNSFIIYGAKAHYFNR